MYKFKIEHTSHAEYHWLSYWKTNEKSQYDYTQYMIPLNTSQLNKFLRWAKDKFEIFTIDSVWQLYPDVSEIFGYKN